MEPVDTLVIEKGNAIHILDSYVCIIIYVILPTPVYQVISCFSMSQYLLQIQDKNLANPISFKMEK